MSSAVNVPMLFGTGQRICNYQYAISSGGNCATYGPSLERHLDAVQQDMDSLKLQYVSQNTVLQEEIRKLRQRASTTDANVNDLGKDLKNLQTSVFTLQAKMTQTPTTNNNNGAANAMLQQLVTTTRAQLTQSMLQLQSQVNAALGSLRTELQRDGVEQSTVDTAFQAQLRQQQKDLTDALQRLQQLQQRVNAFQQQTPATPSPTTPSTTNTPSPTTTPTVPQTTPTPQVTVTAGPVTPSPVLLKLQADLQQLDSRVTQVQKDFPAIKKDVVDLQSTMKNNTDQLLNLRMEVDFLENTELGDLKARLQSNRAHVRSLTLTVQNDLMPLKAQVDHIGPHITSLNQQITRLGSDFLSQKVQLKQDERSINDLNTQLRFQAERLSKLIQSQHFTNPPTSPPPSTTIAIPTPRPRPHGSSGGRSQTFVVPKPVHG
ncbi:hypothetical protein ACOMHN_000082 [Nucella lapillus]